MHSHRHTTVMFTGIPGDTHTKHRWTEGKGEKRKGVSIIIDD